MLDALLDTRQYCAAVPGFRAGCPSDIVVEPAVDLKSRARRARVDDNAKSATTLPCFDAASA